MSASKAFQLYVIEALDSHAYPVERHRVQNGKELFGKVIGVALYCYFRILGYPVCGIYGAAYPLQLCDSERRRSPSAKVYCLNGFLIQVFLSLDNFTA